MRYVCLMCVLSLLSHVSYTYPAYAVTRCECMARAGIVMIASVSVCMSLCTVTQMC